MTAHGDRLRRRRNLRAGARAHPRAAQPPRLRAGGIGGDDHANIAVSSCACCDIDVIKLELVR